MNNLCSYDHYHIMTGIAIFKDLSGKAKARSGFPERALLLEGGPYFK